MNRLGLVESIQSLPTLNRLMVGITPRSVYWSFRWNA